MSYTHPLNYKYTNHTWMNCPTYLTYEYTIHTGVNCPTCDSTGACTWSRCPESEVCMLRSPNGKLTTHCSIVSSWCSLVRLLILLFLITFEIEPFWTRLNTYGIAGRSINRIIILKFFIFNKLMKLFSFTESWLCPNPRTSYYWEYPMLRRRGLCQWLFWRLNVYNHLICFVTRKGIKKSKL